jgi:hypothetical protein
VCEIDWYSTLRGAVLGLLGLLLQFLQALLAFREAYNATQMIEWH